MNIKFGMDNFYVRYLKRFLNAEFQQTKAILGRYDKDDMKLLVQYLNLPNVKTMFEVQKEIVTVFPQLLTLFNMKLKDNAIRWTSKSISKVESAFIISNLVELKKYVYSVGWSIVDSAEWVDSSKDLNQDGKVDSLDREIIYNIVYNNAVYPPDIMRMADLNLDGIVDAKDLNIMDQYLINGKIYLEIRKSNRKNFFPNKDMLVFINQFDGTFLYNYAIRDGIGIDDLVHTNTSGKFKVALFKCKPRTETNNRTQQHTISTHNNRKHPCKIKTRYNRICVKKCSRNRYESSVINMSIKQQEGKLGVTMLIGYVFNVHQSLGIYQEKYL